MTAALIGIGVVGTLALVIGFIADQAGEPGTLLIGGGLLFILIDLVILALYGAACLWGSA